MNVLIPLIAGVAALLTVISGVWVAVGLFKELRESRKGNA